MLVSSSPLNNIMNFVYCYFIQFCFLPMFESFYLIPSFYQIGDDTTCTINCLFVHWRHENMNIFITIQKRLSTEMHVKT